jgi:hypothetical protein
LWLVIGKLMQMQHRIQLFHFDVDPDAEPDPTFQFDADPCGSGFSKLLVAQL